MPQWQVLRKLANPNGLGYTEVGSVTFGGVRFQVYPMDHEPPHVHAFVGDGWVIVDLGSDGRAVIAHRGRAIVNAKANEVLKAVSLAMEHFDDLVRLWEIMHL